MDAKKLAQAKRCQLLVGSFTGAMHSCPCKSPKDCVFTDEQRREYSGEPAVIAAHDRNRQKWANSGTSDELRSIFKLFSPGTKATKAAARQMIKSMLPLLPEPAVSLTTLQVLFGQRDGCWTFMHIFITDDPKPHRFTLEYHAESWKIVSEPSPAELECN